MIVYLHIYYALVMDFESLKDAPVFIYVGTIAGFLISLLSNVKTVFVVGAKDMTLASTLPAALIFMHAGACRNAMFWAARFQ